MDTKSQDQKTMSSQNALKSGAGGTITPIHQDKKDLGSNNTQTNVQSKINQDTNKANLAENKNNKVDINKNNQDVHKAGQAAHSEKETSVKIQEKAGEVYEQAADWAKNQAEKVSFWASDTGQKAKRTYYSKNASYYTSKAQDYARQNPLMLGIAGLATGLLLGALLPRTYSEDKTFGHWSDNMREQGMNQAKDVLRQGREQAEKAFSGDEDDRFASHESEWKSQNSDPAKSSIKPAPTNSL